MNNNTGNSGPSASEVAAESIRMHGEIELKALAPDKFSEYEKLRQNSKGNQYCGMALYFVIGMVLFHDDFIGATLFISLMFSVCLAAVTFWLPVYSHGDKEAAKILNTFRSDMIVKKNKSLENITEISERDSLERGFTMVAKDNANIVLAKDGSTVIINSELKDSLNTTHSENPVLGEALITLLGHVTDHGDGEAKEAYGNLQESIESNDKPSRVKAFWNELVRVLPSAAKLTGAAATITKLFS